MDEPNQAMVHALPEELVGAIMRASVRTAAAVSDEMKVGLDSLATIASVAPWVGLFGTFMGIENSFGELPGEKSACMAAVAGRISVSMWTTGLGLLVGLASLWCYKYLTGKLEAYRSEMERAPFELVDQLSRYCGRWEFDPTNPRVGGEAMFGERPLDELKQDESFWRRSMLLTGASLFAAWCLQVTRYFDHDLRPFDSATWMACMYVLFVLCVSCLPAHVVWSRFLRRRRGGLALLASVICLCWCLTELVLHIHLL